MIRLENTSIRFGKRTLLEDISTEIEGGLLTALIGRNGCGKSTLLKNIIGLGKEYTGKIFLNGKDQKSMSPKEISETISLVTTERVRISNLKCQDIVALGRAPYTNWIGHMQREDRDMVMQSLRLVNMESYAERTVDRMSDGECQRIMIARALAQNTPIILLDEPTSFLDLPNRYELCILLKDLAHKEKKAIFFSTHELDIATNICDSIALIDTPHLLHLPSQKMVEEGHIKRLFFNNSYRSMKSVFKI